MMKGITSTVGGIILVFTSMPSHSDNLNRGNLEADVSGGEQVINTTVDGATLPVTGLVSASVGEAHFRVSHDGNSLRYTLKVSVLPGTPIFMAHIHLGPKGQNGPIILWLFGDNSNSPIGPLVRDDGPFTGEILGVLTAADLFPQPSLGLNTFSDAIKNIMAGNAYVNVHTVAHPPGEIRGQIHDDQDH
jgi:hypothetical protein